MIEVMYVYIYYVVCASRGLPGQVRYRACSAGPMKLTVSRPLLSAAERAEPG